MTEPRQNQQIPTTQGKQRSFLHFYSQNQRRIFAYIYTLVPTREDAEDILQETSITLWEKFDDFDPETDFVAWACQVAYWKVCNANRTVARSPLRFDGRLLSALAEKIEAAQPELDERHLALTSCLAKLNDRDRTLILSRYEANSTVKDVAARSGRTVQAAYKALARIRRSLMDCVTLTMEWGRQ